ncbi:hypothetical protein [Fluviicola taffensis]|uniref:Uncharacterized protein n=1 Tax=Fluviicola taffensis (strain DSM 16823 / NCIMB 13979 / RW262) TaxID=755732 RepID=F2IDL2_FLUTR|nr:hypothetical protein [Fluviicola taffensis]AEA43385.1 hypothetical protein Fluta_1391 [Fluviicola taffensis DSM 16823]
MKKSLLVVSFALLCCSSVFSQELSTTKVAKEKPVKKENALNQAKPISANTPLQKQKESNLNPSKNEEQVLDRNSKKLSKKITK